MRSKAHIKSHPLHPILVCFPIAFFIGAFIFDVLALCCAGKGFERTGQLLSYAGIMGAVAAAVPGIIDFIYTVPPKSSAKKRGAKHGILNVIMLSIFIAAAVIRRENFGWLIVLMELVAIVLMSIAGWMGGTLVHRNQIGIDIRYADAGKWTEEFISALTTQVQVAEKSELKINQMKLLHINGQRIVLGRTDKSYVAFEDRCTHRGASLAAGTMICGTVQCPWHGSQFDCNTGEVKAGPAKEKIIIYNVIERDGNIFINLPQKKSASLNAFDSPEES